MKIIYKGFFALAFVVLYSSLVTIALQTGGNSIGALPLLLYSCVVGTATMLVVSYFQDRGRGFISLLKDKKILLILAVTGIFAYAISTLLFTFGTLGTTPSVSAIIYRTYPLIIALLTPLTLKQRVSSRQLLSLIIGFASVGIVLTNGSFTSINLQELPYIGFVLLSALAVAITTIIIKKYNASTIGFVILANAASTIFTVFIILIFHISVPINLSISTILSIIVIGAFDFGIGSLFFYYSYKVFSTSLVGMSTLAIPFLTIILSFVLLDTSIQPYYFFAAVVLTIGILLHEKGALHAPERVKESPGLQKMTVYDVTSAFIENHTKDIYECIRGNGRALAIKLEGNVKYEKEHYEQLFKQRNYIVFTSREPHHGIRKEEIEFINEIIGLKEGETALIAIGDPKNIESIFEELVS